MSALAGIRSLISTRDAWLRRLVYTAGGRELVFARARFGLMGGVVALIAILVVLLSGLSSGLVNDGVSGLQRLPVTAFAFAVGIHFSTNAWTASRFRSLSSMPLYLPTWSLTAP